MDSLTALRATPVAFGAKKKGKTPPGGQRPNVPAKPAQPAPSAPTAAPVQSSSLRKWGLRLGVPAALFLGAAPFIFQSDKTNPAMVQNESDPNAVTEANLLADAKPFSTVGRTDSDKIIIGRGMFTDSTRFSVLPQGELIVKDKDGKLFQVGTIDDHGNYVLWLKTHQKGNVITANDQIRLLRWSSQDPSPLRDKGKANELAFALKTAVAPQVHALTSARGEGVTIAHLDINEAHVADVQVVITDAKYGIAPRAKLQTHLVEAPKGFRIRSAHPEDIEIALARHIGTLYANTSDSLAKVLKDKQSNPGLKVVIIPMGGNAQYEAEKLAPFLTQLQQLPEQSVPTVQRQTMQQMLKLLANPTAHPELNAPRQRYLDSLKALREAGVLPIVADGNVELDKTNAPAGAFYNMLAISPDALTVGASRPTEGPDGIRDIPSGITPSGVPNTSDMQTRLLARGEFVPLGNNKSEMGSSASVPLVGGLAALLAQTHPDWTPAQIEAALLEATQPATADQPAILAATQLFGGKR